MTGLAVTGGTVVTPGGLVRADVSLDGARIRAVETAAGATPETAGGAPERRRDPGAASLDATNLLVAPGFVDLQCNGAVGIDLTAEPERLWQVAAALPRWGVTAWLPTVVTASPDARVRALAALRAGPPDDGVVAHPLGLHLEGPFLAPERKGAHDPRHIVAPSPAVVDGEGWSREAGVALVTLAPELPGALSLVRMLIERGVVVSAGHSSSTAAEATAAVDAGVTYVTHLFNAMPPLHHRQPGLAGVALTDERVRVGVIADGVHVDRSVVALAARALGDRLNLVTDAVAALGQPENDLPDAAALGEPVTDLIDAEGALAEQSRRIRIGSLMARTSAADGAVRLADGTLAGSTLSLDRAVRNLVVFAGLPLTEAVRAATSTPAAVLGLADRGAVIPRAAGDLVLLTEAGEVVATVVGGRVAHDTRTAA